MSFLLDRDPVSRSKLTVHDDPDNDTGVIIYNEADIEPVLRQNAALRAQTDERARWTKPGGDDRGLGERVASIPVSVYHSLPEEIKRDNNALLKWLEESDQDVFRTRAGRLRRRLDGRLA